LRRFNEFVELNTAIEARVRVSWGLPPFPDKHWKIFTDHLDPDFINIRRTILENYLKKVYPLMYKSTKRRGFGGSEYWK
jgi:hypothetical protein